MILVAPFDGARATAIATLAAVCGVYVPGAGDCGLIATERDALAGFVVWRHVLDEATLLGLAVTRERRRRGIGGCLLDSALAAWQATGIEAVFLEVRASNLAAQALYRSRRFRLYRRRVNYYHCHDGAREDALLMRKVHDRNVHAR